MSILPSAEPVCSNSAASPLIANVIDARARDLGGFTVGRVLPSIARRLVGPFIFFDHMGPAEFLAGQGMDVRPHPHIGLATVTYLFDGEIIHRDSLGSYQAIRPGDINWMTAGSGIVHSERTSPELRETGFKIEGLQLWVALPLSHEETAPQFQHHPGRTLPIVELGQVQIRVLAGSAYGVTSPVQTCSPLLYLDVTLPAGSSLTLPTEVEERAVYVVKGSICCDQQQAGSGRMLVFTPGAEVALQAESDSRVVVVGGAALEGERLIDWNFVSSSKQRLAQARQDWKAGHFPKVPGDELEFIPLPE
jgi:redox-sensitive bicupin YhaK (pirin superfamily)